MVAGCPKCGARYRVDADRIGPDGAKLRCTKCSAVFLVRAPRVAAEAEALGLPLFVPPIRLATDNAVMIAGLAWHLLRAGRIADLTLDALPRSD